MRTLSRRGRAERLRRILAERRAAQLPGVFNALSARVAEEAGFEMVGISGYAVSATLLGKPDAGLITLDEIVMVSRLIVGATSLPVIADADTGFGNAINTMRTVEEFIGAGVSGIHIEDQVAPKRCGHVAGKDIVSRAEAVGKFRAAVRARDELDKDFVLIARTDARGAPGGSTSACIDRCKAYLDAGVDVVFPEGLTSAGELAEVAAAVDAPILYNRTGVSPQLDLDALRKLGIAMVANAGGALRASTRAMIDYLEGFRADDAAHEARWQQEAKGHPAADFHGYIGFAAIRKLEEEFLPPDEMAARYKSSLGYKP